MNAKEALDLFFGRSDAMQQYWMIYVTLVLGILAFFGTVKARSWWLAFLVSVAFAGFAVMNLRGTRDVEQQRVEICQYLAHATLHPKCDIAVTITDPLPVTLHPPSVSSVVWFHRAADMLTLFGIWFLTAVGRRQHSRSERGPNPKPSPASQATATP